MRIRTAVGLTSAVRLAMAIIMTKSAPQSQFPDIAEYSFEAAMAELETIVRKLESGDVVLEESVALYARGDALRMHCTARLADAQARIEQISLSADGAPQGVRPFASD